MHMIVMHIDCAEGAQRVYTQVNERLIASCMQQELTRQRGSVQWDSDRIDQLHVDRYTLFSATVIS
jgi:hypothetical protein